MDEVEKAFAPLVGLPGWNVKKGHGSFLTVEFGNPHLVVREPRPAAAAASLAVQRNAARRSIHIRGDWHLWIYCCDWRLSLLGHEGCHSESEDWLMRPALQDLDGQRLLAVEADRTRGISLFRFDLGALLETSPYALESYSRSTDSDRLEGLEQWMLYAPDRRVFSYFDDGQCGWQTSSGR